MVLFAVCDDEDISARQITSILRRELSSQTLEYRLEAFTSSKELADRLARGTRFDVLFADIDMPDLDGIRLGMLYRSELQDTILIYISNREDLVYDAFRAKPFRFVRKKRLSALLPETLRDVMEELNAKQTRKIAFSCGVNSTVLLLPERISYVEALKKKQMVHYGDDVYEVSSSFQKVAEQLSGQGFVQTHKSYLVNCRYIHAIEKSELCLDSGERIPISRSYFKQVQDAFVQFAFHLRPST